MTSETSYTLRVSSGVTESLLGRVLDGRYRVLSHIADGGMASVYLALDTRLDRDVALKVMRHDLAQDEALRQPVPAARPARRPGCPTPTSSPSSTRARTTATCSWPWSTSPGRPCAR